MEGGGFSLEGRRCGFSLGGGGVAFYRGEELELEAG